MFWIVEKRTNFGQWRPVAVAVADPTDFVAQHEGHRAYAKLPGLAFYAATLETPNPVTLFHHTRGCCDGADASACYQAHMAIANGIREMGRPPAKPKRERSWDEFEGTN